MRNTLAIAILALLLARPCLAIEEAISVDTTHPRATLAQLAALQGMSKDLRVYVYQSGKAYTGITNASLMFLYGTNLTATAVGSATSSSVRTNDLSALIHLPALPPGRFAYALAIVESGQTNDLGTGTLTVSPSSFAGGWSPIPGQLIDWSTLRWTGSNQPAYAASLTASGALWRAEWQAADVVTLQSANATLVNSGGLWRMEWQQAAGASSETVRIALTNEAAIRAAQDALLQSLALNPTDTTARAMASAASNSAASAQATANTASNLAATALQPAGTNTCLTNVVYNGQSATRTNQTAFLWITPALIGAVSPGDLAPYATTAALANYLPLAGGTLNGAATILWGGAYTALRPNRVDSLSFGIVPTGGGSPTWFVSSDGVLCYLLNPINGRGWRFGTPGVGVTNDVLATTGSGAALTGITAAQVGAVPTSDPIYLAAITGATFTASTGQPSVSGRVIQIPTNSFSGGTGTGNGTLTNVSLNGVLGTTNAGVAALTIPATVVTNNQTGVTLTGSFTATGGNCITNNGSGASLTGLTLSQMPAGVLTNGAMSIGYSNSMIYFNIPGTCTGIVFNLGGTNILMKQNN